MSEFKPHSIIQDRALFSTHPLTLLATGIQFGKTTVGALWMKRFLHEYTDPSDNFLITSPTYKILSQSTLPPFLRYMDGYGTYHKQDAMFEMTGGGRCWFRTGTDPDSVVGITNVRAIYGDEAGLYSLYFWENIQARAAFKNAPIMLTTSPYNLNWVYKDLIRKKLRNSDALPHLLYLKARSLDNPYFSREYYERMRNTMDERRFRAMFGGEWEKMDGLVYDCFDDAENTCIPQEFPVGTKFYAGVDWGTTAPFVIVVRAVTPSGYHFQPTEVYKTGQTILDMIRLAKQLTQAYPIEFFYADPSSPGYIEEFCRAGLVTVAADNKIRVGIDYHYELIKSRRYKCFRGDNRYTIDEYETYHYPSEDEVKQDTKVVDHLPVKQSDHACFVAGTPISVPGGYKPIEGFVGGDLVSTPVGNYKVIDAWCTGIKEVQRYEFSDGSSFIATKDHPIYVRNRGFVPLEQITQKDIIPLWNNQRKYHLTEKIILCGAIITDVVAGFCTAMCMSSIMALLQRVLIFITSILTHSIMIHLTWLRYLLPNTMASTPTMLARSDKNKELHTSYRLMVSLNHGTEVQKAVNGIESTLLKRRSFKKKWFALNANQSSRSIHRRRNFVRLIVSRSLDARAALMISIECVLSALKLSKLISIRIPKHVHMVAVEVCSVKESVYALKVERVGLYVTNGFVSGNCDANRYVTLATYQGFHRHDPDIISTLDQPRLTIDERLARIREPREQVYEEY